jgi:hypothetical protein
LELGAYEIACIGVGGMIVGALLTAWAGYRFTLDISKREFENAKKLSEFERFRHAASKFKNIFAEGIAFYNFFNIKTDGHNWNIKWQERYFPAQATAIEEFRPFVKTERLSDYQKAWNEYHHPQGIFGGKNFNEYFIGDEKEVRDNFKKRIDAILEFTKEP